MRSTDQDVAAVDGVIAVAGGVADGYDDSWLILQLVVAAAVVVVGIATSGEHGAG